MNSLPEIKVLYDDLANHADVLIQDSENHYAISQAAEKCEPQAGNQARLFTKRSMEPEIVSQPYHIIRDESKVWDCRRFIGHPKMHRLQGGAAGAVGYPREG